jgi:hypothetical protein
MHAKINRRKADQIDIAEIWYKQKFTLNRRMKVGLLLSLTIIYPKCGFNGFLHFVISIIIISEQILNPVVPLALRLSGILMGRYDFLFSYNNIGELIYRIICSCCD